MEIVLYPHPALRHKSKPVSGIDAAIRETVREMFSLMYESRGIGLAANQVGLPLRLFVINVTGDPEEKEQEHVFINPEIVHRKGSIEGEEGCLSLPEMYGQVRRAETIIVDAFDLQGRSFEATLKDLAARVVQHENDHLDGVLFIDRLTDDGRRELEPKIADLEVRFRKQQQAGDVPSDEEIRDRLRTLEPT